MTDNDIAYGLKCCSESHNEGDCIEKGCPYYLAQNCVKENGVDALDLINRLQYKIEIKDSIIRTLFAEIERLRPLEKKVLEPDMIKQAKEEAYQTLATELKMYCSDLDTDNINEPSVRILWDAEETIDEVLKELVGE